MLLENQYRFLYRCIANYLIFYGLNDSCLFICGEFVGQDLGWVQFCDFVLCGVIQGYLVGRRFGWRVLVGFIYMFGVWGVIGSLRLVGLLFRVFVFFVCNLEVSGSQIFYVVVQGFQRECFRSQEDEVVVFLRFRFGSQYSIIIFIFYMLNQLLRSLDFGGGDINFIF